jgi:hypothetical protein
MILVLILELNDLLAYMLTRLPNCQFTKTAQEYSDNRQIKLRYQKSPKRNQMIIIVSKLILPLEETHGKELYMIIKNTTKCITCS